MERSIYPLTGQNLKQADGKWDGLKGYLTKETLEQTLILNEEQKHLDQLFDF